MSHRLHTGKDRWHFVNRHQLQCYSRVRRAKSLQLIQTMGFRHRSFLQQNCLDPAEGSLRSAARRVRKKDKAGRHLRAGNANVYTSIATGPGFFAHKARTNSSMLARSVDASSQRCFRSSGERSPGNVRLAAARSARELLENRSVHAARRAQKSQVFLVQNNRSPPHVSVLR